MHTSPLAEQRRIVAKVDELMAVVDALEPSSPPPAAATALLAAAVGGLTTAGARPLAAAA